MTASRHNRHRGHDGAASVLCLGLLVGAAIVTLYTQSLVFMSKATAQSSGSTVAVTPLADAHVRADAPSSNFGTRTKLEVDGSPIKIVSVLSNFTPWQREGRG